MPLPRISNLQAVTLHLAPRIQRVLMSHHLHNYFIPALQLGNFPMRRVRNTAPQNSLTRFLLVCYSLVVVLQVRKELPARFIRAENWLARWLF